MRRMAILVAVSVGLCGLVVAAPDEASKPPGGADKPTVVADKPVGGADKPGGREEALTAGMDFRKVVRDAKAKVFPAVVYIRCLRESRESGKKITQEISGSGVVISPRGEVVTNWHVIDKASKVRCLLFDGSALEADVVGKDKDTDLALLQLKMAEAAKDLPYAVFGDSKKLREGDFVMAMGAPWGLNRSVSIGIISCTRRYLPGSSEYSRWLQTDAAINPGNSGGPLVNTEGEIVGINTRVATGGGGVGFAVPSRNVQFVISQLREHGKVAWTWTGLRLQPLKDFNRETYYQGTDGVIVAATDPDSPAREAGVKPSDRILAVNGKAVSALREEDVPAVRRLLGLLPKKKPAKLTIRRKGVETVVTITPREKGKVEGEELDCPRFDFTIKAINQFANPELYFHIKQGVYVFGVKQPGNAAPAGLRPKDIILRIDGKKITTLDEMRAIHKQLVDNVKTKHRVQMVVLRSGLMHMIVLDFQRDYERD